MRSSALFPVRRAQGASSSLQHEGSFRTRWCAVVLAESEATATLVSSDGV